MEFPVIPKGCVIKIKRKKDTLIKFMQHISRCDNDRINRNCINQTRTNQAFPVYRKQSFKMIKNTHILMILFPFNLVYIIFGSYKYLSEY